MNFALYKVGSTGYSWLASKSLNHKGLPVLYNRVWFYQGISKFNVEIITIW